MLSATKRLAFMQKCTRIVGGRTQLRMEAYNPHPAPVIGSLVPWCG